MADKPNYITLAHLRTAMSALLNKIDTKPDEEDFANVAFSGDYSDLTNRPDLTAYVNWTTYSELTDYVSSVASVNGILKGDGSGNITAATAGTDYQTPLPSQTSQSGKFLTTNGTALSWATVTQDDHKWNDVTLNKSSFNNDNNVSIPYLASTSATTASLMLASRIPNISAIAKYDSSAYLNSTTPEASDNSTKVATTAFVKSKIESLGTVLNYKGTKATAAALPSSENTAGDVWIVTEDNSEHVWNGSAWEELGPTIDLSGYMEKGIDYVTAGQLSGETLGQYATAEGYETISSGEGSHTEGLFSTASHDASHAEGSETIASGQYSHAEGNTTIASGYSSHSEGSHTFANDLSTHTEGANTVASGQTSHAEGYNTITVGAGSHTEGYYTIAIGEQSHAEGIGFETSSQPDFEISGSTNGQIYTYPSTYSSIPEEDFLQSIIKIYIDNIPICKRITSVDTTNFEITLESSINDNSTSLNSAPCYLLRGTSIGIASHSEGNVTIASGNYSHAEGLVTVASGQSSHAEGNSTTASGQSSHAEGNSTIASGQSSHAEGLVTVASGQSSHAEGLFTVASGESSHAEGQHTTAQRRSQHTFGEYNILDTTGTATTKGQYIEIVGNGTTSARSNARTLDWSGNETLAGKLTLGAGPVNNMDAATKQYVDNAVGSACGVSIVDSTSGTAVTTDLSELVINKLTKAQYDAIATPNPNQLYMITDDTIYAEKSYVDNLLANVDALPSQAGNSGKFLTTNGTTASWADNPKEIMWVTVSNNGSTYSADKTYTEIYTANNGGKYVIAKDQFDNKYPLVYCGEDNITFSFTQGTYYKSVSVTNANVWDVYTENPQYAAASHNHDASNITSGTLPITRGGTGATSVTQGGVIYGSSTTAYASTAAGTSGYLLQSGGTGAPSWINATNANTGSTIVKRDSSGNFSAGTITATLNGNASTATSATSATNATNTTNVNIAADTSSTIYVLGATTTGNTRIYRESSVYMASDVLYGAAWNDYAEYRKAKSEEPGRCVKETKEGILELTSKRMEKGCEIISDTFGFAIGKDDEAKTPIAATGRVLAYTDKPRETFELGMPVCSGPNGTVSQMTEEEARMYPWCIIGTVSEIPTYEEWGENKVKVNERIWIRIR